MIRVSARLFFILLFCLFSNLLAAWFSDYPHFSSYLCLFAYFDKYIPQKRAPLCSVLKDGCKMFLYIRRQLV